MKKPGKPKTRSQPEQSLELPKLTPRENEVQALLEANQSRKQIAAALLIKPRTVRHHVESIERKWRIRGSRAIAVAKLQFRVAALELQLADMAKNSLAKTRQFRRRPKREKGEA